MQQRLVLVGEPVIEHRIARGRVTRAHRRIAQRGDEDDVREHTAGEQRADRGILDGLRLHAPRGVAAYVRHGVVAAGAHPSWFGEPRRDIRLQRSEPAVRVGDDPVAPEARRQVIRAEHRLGVAQPRSRHVRDVEQRAAVPALARRSASRRLAADHDVDV